MNSVELLVVMASLLMQNDGKNPFDAAAFASDGDIVGVAVDVGVGVGFVVAATLLSSN